MYILWQIVLIIVLFDEIKCQCIVGYVNSMKVCKQLLSESILMKYYIENCQLNKKNPNSNINENRTDFPEVKYWSDFKLCSRQASTTPIDYLPTDNFVRLFVDILDTETDMITVKVHNELVPKINKHVIEEKSMYFSLRILYMRSGYFAAYIYYLINDIEMALEIIKAGLIHFDVNMELLLLDEKNERYISTWKINQIILKEELDTIKANQSNDFENSVFPIFNVELEKTDESINQKPISNFFGDTSNEMKINYENKYLKTSTKKYPHPLIMYFMDELLKTPFGHRMRNPLHEETIKNTEISCFQKKYDYPTLSYLLLAKIFYSEDKLDDAYQCLLKAITEPVKTIDNRVLNYKAHRALKEMYNLCYKSKSVFEMLNLKKTRKLNFCRDNYFYPQIDEKTQKFIKDKLGNILNYDFYYELFEKEIKTNVLFYIDFRMKMIISTAVNMDKSPEVELKFKNVIESIKLLENHVQNVISKKKKKNENDYKIHKWLAALYGARCRTRKDSENCEEKIIEHLDKANEMLGDVNKDAHLQSLNLKLICKKTLDFDNWEHKSRPDGWNLPKYDSMEVNVIEIKKYCLRKMIEFKNMSKYLISKAEIHIFIAKAYWETNQIAESFKSLSMALKYMVITPYESFYNYEAHEILSVFTLWHNYNLKLDRSENINWRDIFGHMNKDSNKENS